MIVDSSVWIAELRGEATTRATEILKIAIVQQQVVLGDLILLELLQGARDEHQATLLNARMSTFPIVAMMSPALAIQAAINFRTLRSRGVTIRKTVDLIIGSYCIENNHLLLQRDRDFAPMVEHLGLRLA